MICYGLKMNVRMYYAKYFDMKNVCLHVPYDMLWCAKYMFACAVQYAMVCKMNVCMYHMTCLACEMNVYMQPIVFAVLSQTVGNLCPAVEQT